MPIMIDVKNIVKRYGTKTVLNNISLQIKQGEVIAITGENGAGKSTLLDIILGIQKQESGTITYAPTSLQKQVGVQLQTTPFFPDLTAKENIQIFAAFYRMKLNPIQCEVSLSEFELQDVSHTLASKLSGGQKKKLAIAIATVYDPSVIFLDEPTASLDPKARIHIKQLSASLAKKGKTIMLTSHDMEEVSKLATRLLMLKNGRIVLDGAPEQLLEEHQKEDLESLYLSITGG
ncbi:ABC transporter ATP-binding protein [Longirhabdus pacifica]|uniref:ABC transporter ATP-binding protein n=1 Tax=Longirhabdus pacifica TaxID=2305227 RepID=UPI001008FADF|nr:ABC transporter ATP-binding protein [Longirhabdus pacifica]